MKLVGKEYRCINPIPSHYHGDVQDVLVEYNAFIYIYIYDEEIALRSTTNALHIDTSRFGNLNEGLRKTRLKNIRRRIEVNKSPSSISKYKLDGLSISMSWVIRDMEISFEGNIMLEGDAIKGTFFKNGKVNVQEQVYYNIEKPLPTNLIENDA